MSAIEKEIQSYDLEGKVSNIVTDNGANFCLAVKRLKEKKQMEAKERHFKERETKSSSWSALGFDDGNDVSDLEMVEIELEFEGSYLFGSYMED